MKSFYKVIFCISSMLATAQLTFAYQQNVDNFIIYNNFASVQETRRVDIYQGTHSYILDNLPNDIQIESIYLEIPDNDIEIVGQEYRNNTFNFLQLLDASLGKRISIILVNGQKIDGVYYGISQNDIIIRIEDKFTSINRSRIESFSIEDSTQEGSLLPHITFSAESRRNGETDVKLHYLLNTISWSGKYIGIYDSDRQELSISSWAYVKNNSDKQFSAQSVVLIAGEVHRAPAGVPLYPETRSMLAMSDIPQSDFQDNDTNIFHTYTLKSPLQFVNNSNQEIRLFPEKTARIDEKFIFATAQYGEKVINVLEFTNDKTNGFGEAVPGGFVRLYQKGENGKILIGEDKILNTPLNGRITIQTGTAFDLTGKRIQKNFRRIGDRGREETYEIELTNGNGEVREIIVRESFNYGEWRILNSSITFTVLDAQTAEFHVTVEPESSATINYTVQYN